MKIDNSYTNVATTLGGTSSTKPQTTAKVSVAVELSSVGTDLGSGETSPPVDSNKIAEIKQAISEGRFTINTGAIADRLIATAKDMIATQQKG